MAYPSTQALLRMGRNYTKRERENRVHTVMSELGLVGAAHTLIGTPHIRKSISGGEKKRLAFASEILTSPPLLFCDEPTSGLDAYLAKQVVEVLRQLAQRKGMTVVITIHQPSSQVFEMFDKIGLLAEGRVAFIGSIEQAGNMWNELGWPLPENFNPADHFISTLSIESGKERKSHSRIQRICDKFLSTVHGKQYIEDSLASSAGGTRRSSSTETSDTSSEEETGKSRFAQSNMHRYKSTWCQQFWALTKRSFW
jgi:ABC-type multidrug transport system ATPase subunit